MYNVCPNYRSVHDNEALQQRVSVAGGPAGRRAGVFVCRGIAAAGANLMVRLGIPLTTSRFVAFITAGSIGGILALWPTLNKYLSKAEKISKNMSNGQIG